MLVGRCGHSWGQPLALGVSGGLELPNAGGMGTGMGWDLGQIRTAGRSWVEKNWLKGLYLLGQWLSAFLKGMIKKGNNSSVVGQTHLKMFFRM